MPRLTITVDDLTSDELEQESKERGGVSKETAARWILGTWASSKRKKREQAQREKDDGSVYGP